MSDNNFGFYQQPSQISGVHLSFQERQLLASRPPEGTGLHQWIFHAVCKLIKRHSDASTKAILIVATHDCKRDTRREIDDAIRRVRGNPNHSGTPREYAPVSPRWPRRDDALIKTVLQEGCSMAGLLASSPYRFDQMPRLTANELLKCLFPGDPLLCLGWSKSGFTTMTLSEWQQRNFAGRVIQFVVPSPMCKRIGTTLDGRPSAKTNDNTGPRRFLVVEFDFKPDENPADAMLLKYGSHFGLANTLDLCACLLSYLSRFQRLALVVWSGNKSLQGWFPVAGLQDTQVSDFFKRASILGADTATWTPSQFVRMPYGIRENGNEQTPVYFDPSTLSLL